LKLEPAKAWDKSFVSQIDLFITKDKAICLSCHQRVVGMPSTFRAIDPTKHLEEQGAADVSSPDVCFECHSGHSPGI
jgi:nitrate reductase cytochrome c-type subunit